MGGLKEMLERGEELQVVAIGADGDAEMAGGQGFVVGAGSSDDVVFYDEALPEVESVERFGDAEEEEVGGGGVDLQAQALELAVEAGAALVVQGDGALRVGLVRDGGCCGIRGQSGDGPGREMPVDPRDALGGSDRVGDP